MIWWFWLATIAVSFIAGVMVQKRRQVGQKRAMARLEEMVRSNFDLVGGDMVARE